MNDLPAARLRLERLAGNLCSTFEPMQVAASFIAVGVTVIAAVLGKEAAADYLSDLADELADDDDPAWGGRA